MKRLGPILEITVGLLALTTANLIWFAGDPGFLRVSPHPYLIIVLLLAALYGSPWGLGSAFAASLTLLGLSQAFASQAVFTAVFSFFAAALLVGIGVDFHRQAKRQAQDLAEQKIRELADSEKEKELLREEKKDIESRLVGESVTLNAVYVHARAMGNLLEKDIPGAILDLLEKFMGAEQALVYLAEGGELMLAQSRGVPEAMLPSKKLPARGMGGFALTQGKAVSFTDYLAAGAKETSLDLMAAPLMDGNGLTPVGVIVVRRLPFHRLNAATVGYLGLIADWASTSLRQARAWERAVDQAVDDPVVPAVAASYWRRRLKEEFQRSRRFHLDLSIVLLQIRPRLGEAKITLIEAQTKVAGLCRPILRNIDLLGRAELDGTLAVLLSATPKEQVSVVTGKLAAAVKDFLSASELDMRFGTSTLTPQQSSAEELYLAAEKSLIREDGA